MQPIHALNRLNEIATGFIQSQAFFAACRIGLFEVLEETGGTAPEQLAARLGIHPDGCHRLLACLCGLELVERDARGMLRNTELGRYLTSRADVPLEPIALWGELFYHMWEFVPEMLREWTPRWVQALGATSDETFAALYAKPEGLRRFVQFMSAYSAPIGQAIAGAYDFRAHGCLLDVAGGALRVRKRA